MIAAVSASSLAAQSAIASAHAVRAHAADMATELFVSPSGAPGGADTSCSTAAYSTIQSAVDAAPVGAGVVVCAGHYTEDVVISSPLTLRGEEHAVIIGSSTANGMCDQLGPAGPGSAPCLAGVTIKSSHVTVEGFEVRGATGEGILATGSLAGGSIGWVKIVRNRVVDNDLGAFPPTSNSPYPQCSASGQVPGDCGEGIHLMGVTDSTVARNFISRNSGGVLLTDEFGPTRGNTIADNTVTRNAFDCGITVPGHNPFALDAQGHRQGNVAGVYNNVIRGNTITDNGLSGEGAGVLFANAGPGTGSYDNTVEGNFISGNELSGVTMHAHTLPPGLFEDLNGNRIIGNVIETNNLGSPLAGPGDSLDGPPITDPFTTGVLVFSGSVPVHVTIENNTISHNQYGVWLGKKGLISGTIAGNTFVDDGVPVYTHP